MESADVIPAFLKLQLDAYATMARATVAPTVAPQAPMELDQSLRIDSAEISTNLSRQLDPALHWTPSMRSVGARVDSIELFERLRSAYNEPQRHYHTLQQLVECLAWLVEWKDAAEHPHQVALAIGVKDAVLDPMRHDNEGRSARLAFDSLIAAGAETDVARRGRDLVVATRHDSPAGAADARLLVDIDMAVLGASAQRYAEFERGLRREQAHITDFIYRRRRIEALKSLSARIRIYHTDIARAQLEARARANIASMIARLQSRSASTEQLFQ